MLPEKEREAMERIILVFTIFLARMCRAREDDGIFEGSSCVFTEINDQPSLF